MIEERVDLSSADQVVREALGRVFPAAQVEVRLDGQVLSSRAYGWLDPETRQLPVQTDNLFDLASVTKLFVVAAFMTLVEHGIAGLDQPVSSILPEFSGRRPIRPYEDPLRPGAWVEVAPPGSHSTTAYVDASRVTFRQLLAHNSGLPAWRPLYRAGNPTATLEMALGTHFSYPIGMRVVYSDIGLILLGISMERMTGQSLDMVVRQRVLEPAGLRHTRYLPISEDPPIDTVAPTEICKWRGRRLYGEVHDENAAALGGVAGHAGLFATASDVAAFGQIFLDGGAPLLRPSTVAEMTRLQSQDNGIRRGLGFALWSPDPETSGHPFSPRAYGHLGFTGTSLWIDPERSLVVACLTNRVYGGRESEDILRFRIAFHRAIVEALDWQRASR